MKKYRLVAAIIVTYLIVLVVWVSAFIFNLPASSTDGVTGKTASKIRNADLSPTASNGEPVNDYASLVSGLSTVGLTVTPMSKRASPLLNGKGQVISINSVEVQVFEYVDIAAANTDAAQISADGETIGYRIITWSSTPHFYKKGRLIVLYVGKDPATMNILQGILGSPFAGI